MPEFSSFIVTEATGPHFKCEKCGTATRIHKPASLLVFACPSCRKIYARDHFELYGKIKNSDSLKTRADLPPIGAVGKLGERTYTVIGIANKRETRNFYAIWKEIVLIDDLGTISFLNCSYGHYTLLTEDPLVPAGAMLLSVEEKFEHEDIKYQFFSSYKYDTISFKGEFHYDVVDVRDIQCHDYLSPPHIISIEKNGSKNPVAFKGIHMRRKEVAAMFEMPEIADQNHEGIGMAQPFYGGLNVRRFNLLSLAFLGILFVATILFSSLRFAHDGPILFIDRELSDSLAVDDFISRTFIIPEEAGPAFLTIHNYADVDNEWVETQLTLVNESTGEEREYAIGIEYYSGVDGGYSWSEGEQKSSINLSAIPAGTYHLKGKILYSGLSEARSYTLQLGYSDPSAWNLGVILIPYLVFLIILLIIKRQFERMRTGEIDNLFGGTSS